MKSEFSIPFILLLAALLVGGAVMVASAQTEGTLGGISFPVAELGNCGDRASCETYCDDAANMDACVEFAKTHGLMNQEEAERGKKFAAELRQNAGPGGCTTPGGCKSYCDDVANLNVCIEFAKKHKLNDKKTAEVARLAAYLTAGGAMPGNCDSAASCRSYCGDFAHADECRAFAEKAGLATSEGRNAVPPGQFQKLAELARNGRTPGGCTSSESCNAYCGDPSHRDECIAFGKEAGIIPPERADALTRLGGVGPGGCGSREACQTFCNIEENREACFAFAKEHGLVSPEELKKAEEGLIRFRQGFSQAPTEVVACLKSHLGAGLIEEIQAGTLTPGPEIGERTRMCFERFGKKVDITEEVKRAPANVVPCLKEKVGNAFSSLQTGKATMTPEIADAIRVCGERAKLLMPMEALPGTRAREGAAPDMHAILRSAPQHVQACVREKLGGPAESASETGADALKEALRGCYESFKPVSPLLRPSNVVPNTRTAPSSLPKPGSIVPTAAIPQFRPAVLACLKDNLSPETLRRLLSGAKPDGTAGIISKCTAAGDAYVRPVLNETAPVITPVPTLSPTTDPALVPVSTSTLDANVLPAPPPPAPVPAL
ncbi:MAG: hypothetical protein Q8Q36_00205 [bacterium]|nr:hypothetical protein [bacterium]